MQQKQSNKPKKQPKPNIPLLELLAINATGPSRLLLKKHGKEDAKGYEDLRDKLADLYQSEKDKIAIEKEFAEIHPHKEFILKYLAPKVTVNVPEPTASCEGNPNCNCDKTSSADGLKETTDKITRDTNFMIAAVAIVGIVGLVFVHKLRTA